MKHFPIFLFTGILLAMIGCKAPAEKEAAESTTPEEKRNIYTADDGHTVGINVELNKGAKWEANVETTEGIGAMLGMVGDMPENPSLEDYRALHVKLSTSFQSILQKCTMKGEAHNQLHNYLMPLKEKIDKLEEGDLETCKRVAPDIKDYLLKYSHFFFT